METWLYAALGVLLGLAVGWSGRIWWFRRGKPQAWPLPRYPFTAMLVDASGAEVSRRTIHAHTPGILRPHGRGRVEQFVYTGKSKDGCSVYQVTPWA